MQSERGEAPDVPSLWIELAVMDEGYDPSRIQKWDFDAGAQPIPRLSVMLAPLAETVQIDVVKVAEG